jgi:hypothetical protein
MLDNNNIFNQQIITRKNEKTRRTIRTSKFEFQIDINLTKGLIKKQDSDQPTTSERVK